MFCRSGGLSVLWSVSLMVFRYGIRQSGSLSVWVLSVLWSVSLMIVCWIDCLSVCWSFGLGSIGLVVFRSGFWRFGGLLVWLSFRLLVFRSGFYRSFGLSVWLSSVGLIVFPSGVLKALSSRLKSCFLMQKEPLMQRNNLIFSNVHIPIKFSNKRD